MLVLTRKAQQQIRVGNNVVITILRVKGQAVRVGIDAPKNVRVVRAELPLLSEAADAETELSVEIAPAKPVTSSEQRPGARRQQTSFDKSSPEVEETGRPRLAPVNLSRGLASRIAQRHRMSLNDHESPMSAADLGSRMASGFSLRG